MMRRGRVVALVVALVAAATLVVGPAGSAGASVNITGTVSWAGGALPNGAGVLRACPASFFSNICPPGTVAPDVPLLTGSYSISLPDTGAFVIWPLSTGRTVSNNEFTIGTAVLVPNVTTV